MPAGSPGLHRLAVGLALALGLALVAISPLLLVAPALGHSYLNNSNPKNGETLEQAPRQVTLTFSEAVRDTGLGVTAKGPQGGFPLDATAAAKEVIADWPGESTPGSYTVSYRAVSIDGHVMNGSISFDIAAPKTSPTPGASVTPELYESPDSEIADSATSDVDKAPEGVPPWVFFLGALIAAGGIAAGVLRGRSKDQ